MAQTRRIHFARSLLSDSALSIADIAFASGFGSLRRFNASFRSACRVRRGSWDPDGAVAPAPDDKLELRLRFRTPYAWQAMLRFLAPRATPGVEAVSDDAYRRSISVEGTAGVIEVALAGPRDCLILRMPASASRGLTRAVERVRHLFDLSADPREIYAILGGDGALAAVCRA